MWVVAEEDYDRTLVDFALLAESDRLEQTAEMDRLYTLARLFGVAMVDLPKLYDEHRGWRDALVSAPTPQVSDDLMRRAAALFKRARAAEARHGAH